MKDRKSTKRFLWLLSFVALACQGDPGPPTEGRLLPGDEQLTAEQKRLREMQYMIVVSAIPDDGAQEVWDLGRPGAATHMSQLLGLEISAAVCTSQVDGQDPDFSCLINTCALRYAMMGAAQLLRASEGAGIKPGRPVLGSVVDASNALRVSTNSAFSDQVSAVQFPPQSAATRAWIANLAASKYRTIIVDAKLALDRGINRSSGYICTDEGFDNLAATGAVALRQALIGLERALEEASRLTVAVADQQLGSSTQASISTARGLAGEDLSRAAAAHLYLGGKPGIQGDTKKALCSSFEFTQQAQKAIDIIRQLAPPPAKILELADGFSSSSNDGVLEEFLNGIETYGSLKERFEAMRGEAVQIDTIQSHFNLRASDFAEAIKYLGQELRAYSRNLTTVVSSAPAGTFPRYAAVATPPAEQPDAYWAALTRTDVPLDGTGNESMAPSVDWRANFLGFADPFFEIPTSGSWAPGSFVDWVSLTTGLASSRMAGAPEGAQKVLRDLVGASESLGFFEHRSFESGDQFSVRLFRDDNVAYYAAVGDDVMRCAVQGVIEGQPCNPWVSDNLENPMLAKLETDNYLIGVTSGVTTARISPMMRVGSRRAYLLRSRPGWVATAGETEPGAGDFEAVMGIPGHRVHGYGVNAQMIRQYGIVPSAETRAAEFMKLSQLDCTRPQLSCAPGGPNSKLGRFDERLPLENELSEDQDGVESSWKYYLTRARDAANASDALAREYVSMRLLEEQRGESLTQRAEDIQRAQEEKASAALDRVQQICGTSVEPEWLLIRASSAPTNDCEPEDLPPPDMECVNGTWVLSLQKVLTGSDHPEVEKLGRCLRSLEDPKNLQLSKSELCYWEDDAGNICGREWEDEEDRPESSAECPKRVPSLGCEAPYELAPIPLENSLQLFELPETDGENVDDDTCSDVRLIRSKVAANTVTDGSSVSEALGRLRASGIFSVPRLNELRGQLSVRATYGNYVSIDLGGRRWLSTGSAMEGLTGATWPCADEPPTGLCAADGIRCETYDCSDDNQRIGLNDRLLDAFMALELISQPEPRTEPSLETHIEFWLPVRLQSNLYPLGFGRDDRGFGSSSPFFPSVLYEWSNADWKVYSPNGTFPSIPLFTRRGEELDIAGQVGEDHAYRFALARADRGPIRLAGGRTVDAFFAGLRGGFEVRPSIVGAEENLGDGYFLLRAQGRSHAEALKGVAKATAGSSLLNATSQSTGQTMGRTIHPLGDPLYFDCESAPLKEQLNNLQLQYHVRDLDPSYPGCPSTSLVRVVGGELDPWTHEEALWDALELACEAQTESNTTATACSQPISVQDMSDLGSVANYLDCVAGNVAASGAKTILSGVPAGVAEELKEAASRTDGGVDPVRGELGVLYSQMREAIVGLGLSSREFARIFRGFSVELRQIKSRLRQQELNDQLANLQFDSTVSEQLTRCVSAISEASGWFKNIQTFGAHWGSVAATCANTGIQTGIASRVRDVTKAIHEEQRKIIFGDAETQFLLLEHAIDAQALEVNRLAETLQRSLAQIDSLRNEAKRRINDAVWYLSYEDGTRNEIVDTIMGDQALAAQKRYQQAHANAQRWSFLARRAIEQRLGIELNRLREDLPLVEAPQKWADSVCATSPIKYQKERDGKIHENPGFAEAFIGDYVTKLENVVESYRLQFSFQEGEDVAVVSLRDDVMNVKAECEAPSENQLFHTGRFGEARQAVESREDVWQVVGCIEPTGMPGAGYGAACLSADQVDSPFQAPGLVDGVTRGYELTFSNGTPDCAGNAAVTDGEGIVTGGCSWTPETRLTQKRSLSPGHYRFSWYSPIVSSGPNPGAYAGGVWDEEGNPLVSQAASQSIAGNAGRVWARHFLEFELDEPKVVEVGFARGDEELIEDWEDQWKVTVGAPMLDFVESRVPSQYRGPKPYQNIGDTLTVMSPNCEDTDGDVFRATQWKSRCERVCPAGFGGICPEDAVEQCYREASFFISQRAIETGEALVQSGFARGNFNYRFDSVAVNFVGTGLRACETSTSPSTCFGSGFVPYSLYHKGPYFVRNHYGEDYRAHLFEGVIEHARGLAAERYLSNPIGKTDRELLEDFTRTEYQGRPLDGHFVLRVWEEPGVNFSALEDVQLILKYRYWSR